MKNDLICLMSGKHTNKGKINVFSVKMQQLHKWKKKRNHDEVEEKHWHSLILKTLKILK